ncbi:MAG: hypothetical protein PHW74_10495 [Desulfobacca sp.]|nr:hypothetical protein [Desulfobacca sp.]
MILPGGLWQSGERQRQFAFKPLTGAVELALAEASLEARSRPEAVTAVLTAALLSLGNLTPTPERVEALSVGDRQFLGQQLAVWLGQGKVWMTAQCRRCGEPFDFPIHFYELPVKEAGSEYPFAQVTTSLGKACWRVPTGADQRALARRTAGENGTRFLVERCLVNIPDLDVKDDTGPWLARLSDSDVHQVEAALEAVAPEVTTAVRVACLACGQDHRLEIDPYLGLRHLGTEITAEVHLIASVYHWSEAEILALPRARRQRYLQLIDRSRGLVG